jgi:hypothetical protein
VVLAPDFFGVFGIGKRPAVQSSATFTTELRFSLRRFLSNHSEGKQKKDQLFVFDHRKRSFKSGCVLFYRDNVASTELFLKLDDKYLWKKKKKKREVSNNETRKDKQQTKEKERSLLHTWVHTTRNIARHGFGLGNQTM